MNERIQELAKQAGFKILTDGRIIPTLDHNGECGRDLQKFADLLLEEVMQTLFITGHESAFDELNKHFGV